MDKRFDEIDRSAVTRVIEKEWNVSLQKVGRWRVYFKDTNQRRYIVIGGEGYEGIDKAIFKEEHEQNLSDTVLIFAHKRKDQLRVFSAQFGLFLDAASKLTDGSDGKQYQFDLKFAGSKAIVHQAPELALDYLFEIPYADDDKKIATFIFKINRMDPKERAEVIKLLEQKAHGYE